MASEDKKTDSDSGNDLEEFDSSDLKVPKVEDLDSYGSEQINLDKTNSEEGAGGDDFSQLAKLEAEAKENYQKYLYAMAEIDNMKKRHIKERSELIKYNGENIARDMLEILDDLERTLEQGSEISSEVLFEGVQLISSRMKSIFDRHQVKVHDASGKKFDPSMHEALTMTPSSDVEVGTVLHQLKKAYFLKDKLLRPAQVVVASEPEASSDKAQSE